MVKTLMRPEGLGKLLESIRRYYPELPVIVVDDSPEPYPEVSARFPFVHHQTFPFDVGIGHCLNWVLDTVDADYVVLLEDDFQFCEKTDIPRLVVPVKTGLYDIMGGGCMNMNNGAQLQRFVGRFRFVPVNEDDMTVEIDHFDVDQLQGITPCDVALNFFAARVDVLKDLGWDEELKVARHMDFFLRARAAGLTVGYHPKVLIEHHTYQDSWQYAELRSQRLPTFQQMFYDKHGLTEAQVPVT